MLGAVVLTPEEQELWDAIPFRHDWLTGQPPRIQDSMDAAHALTISLLRRKAIPQIRVDYFMDPELNISQSRSRKQIFEKNGTSGEEIFSHPAFFRYLQYFVEGPDLPHATIDRFGEAVRACGMVTSGDQAGLQSLAREEVRRRGLERKGAAEEFFKLALELDLDSWDARGIRDSVMRMKVR
jgi:hypothetical protein